jgi:hypothetical protein
MGKFFRVLFFLLFLSTLGATAYLNFIVVGADEAAVLVEKTKGIISPPLGSGRHWVWGVSIPGKYKIYRCSLRAQSTVIKIHKKIIDAVYMDLGEDFDIIIPLRISYKIQKYQILTLFENLDRNFNMLPNFLKRQITPVISLKYKKLAAKEDKLDQVQDRLQLYIQRDLKDEIYKPLKKNGIIIQNLSIALEKDFQVPVLSITEKEKYKKYDDFLKKKKDEVLKNISFIAEMEALEFKDKLYRKNLTKIGPILKKYPHLQNYIAIQKLSPKVSLILSDFTSLNNLGWFKDVADMKAGKLTAKKKKGKKSSKKSTEQEKQSEDQLSEDDLSEPMPPFKYTPSDETSEE